MKILKMINMLRRTQIKKAYFVVIWLVILNIILAGCGKNIDSVSTNNYKNKKLEFYYYIPTKILEDHTKEHPVLICLPGLGGDGSDYKDSPFQAFAEKEGFILICPSFRFDEDNWKKETSYQYPAAWSGEALKKIVNKVETQYNLQAGKYYLYGFSAGAQFALRFAILNPKISAAVVGHGCGGLLQPNDASPVKFYISVGKDDTERISLARENYNRLRRLGIDTTYKIYEGAHEMPPSQVEDSMRFFKATRTTLGE
jgi:predicted esterase